MAGIFGETNIFNSQPWTGRKGYTDFGNLSPEDLELLGNFKGKFADTDFVWGTNDLKGTVRKWMGKTPYAVSDDLLNTARAGGASTAAATNAATQGKLASMFNNSSPLKSKLSKLPGMLDKASKAAPFLIQGYQAVSNLDKYGDTTDDLERMMASIGNSASSNPLATSYLTNDQMSQLRKLKYDDYEADGFNLGDAFSDKANLLKGAGSGAMMGLPFLFSNPYVMLATAGLGAINAGIENAGNERAKEMSQLEGLYNTLQMADQDYRSMRRPPISGLGVQSRYQNMYM